MTQIRKFVVFGDSLSDRGRMAQSELAPLSGLEGKSPEGRFTNGYVWFEYFLRDLLGELKVFGDATTIGIPAVPDLAQTFCIGGMTAYNYQKISLTDELSQLQAEAKQVGALKVMVEAMADPIEAQVLWNLEAMRKSFFESIVDVGENDKAETLVLEWSGANDLITINQFPTKDAVELAVAARLEHVEAMIAAGYRHFVLFNLPALDLTPRFQCGDEALREETKKGVELFNARLKAGIDLLQEAHAECSIHLFDANIHFQNAYMCPKDYGFDEDKKTAIYTESEAFRSHGIAASDTGYLFWDRVHPIKAVHEILAGFFKALFETHYTFNILPENQIDAFRKRHAVLIAEEKRKSHWCCYGLFGSAELRCEKDGLTLEAIQAYAEQHPRSKAMQVLNEFGLTNLNSSKSDASVLPAQEAGESERLVDAANDEPISETDLVVEVGDALPEIERQTWHTF